MITAEWTNRDNLSIETTGQNSKAILVIDMPNNCEECNIIHLQEHGESSICDSGDWSKRPSWCPLRPLPQKRINKDCLVVHEIWNEGWNACLDEIVGDNNDEV